MWNLNNKTNEQMKQNRKRFRDTETNWWLPEKRGMGLGKTGGGDEEVQTSSYKISYRDVMHSTGNTVNNIAITLYDDSY